MAKATSTAKKETTGQTASGRKVIKRLIIPLLKMVKGETIEVKLMGAIYTGKPQKDAKEGDKPADLCNVVNLDTGEEMQIIVPAVLKSNLEEQYPKQGYVDKCFAITKGEQKDSKAGGGRKYSEFTILEIEE